MSVIIRLENLPSAASSLDIRRYFTGLSIPDGGVHITGGEKGVAFITFASDEHARQAMSRDGGSIKGTQIQLFLSSRNEMQSVVDQARNSITVHSRSRSQGVFFKPEQQEQQQPQQPQQQQENQHENQVQQSSLQPQLHLPPGSDGQYVPYPAQSFPPQNYHIPPQPDNVIYMKGIPFDMCTDHDVLNFFSGLNVARIVFEFDSQSGKPSGNAFIQFLANQDKQAALNLNFNHMGRRYIEVFTASREDMEEAHRIGLHLGLRDTQSITNGVGGFSCSSVCSPAFNACGPGMMNGSGCFAGTTAGNGYSDHPPLYLPPPHNQSVMSDLGNVSDIGNGFACGPVGFAGGGEGIPRAGFNNRGGFKGVNRFYGPRMRGGMNNLTSRGFTRTRDPFAESRCVVYAYNVPAKSSNEDLRRFFVGFNVLPNGIERRLNDKGLATPVARIAFKNNQEAQRAVKVMHKKPLHGRQIFLRFAT